MSDTAYADDPASTATSIPKAIRKINSHLHFPIFIICWLCLGCKLRKVEVVLNYEKSVNRSILRCLNLLSIARSKGHTLALDKTESVA